MREEEEIEIPLADGETKTYILSSFPAIAGREIITQYPTTAMPKVGDYKTNEALMLKIMSYVAVKLENGIKLRLTTRELVDNHVPEFETLMRLEWAMMRKNCSFFRDGRASTFFDGILDKALQSITPMLTALLQQLSAKS